MNKMAARIHNKWTANPKPPTRSISNKKISMSAMYKKCPIVAVLNDELSLEATDRLDFFRRADVHNSPGLIRRSCALW